MSSFSNHTDQELFNLTSQGDVSAFAEIFRRYDKRIYPFVFKMIKSEALAEDITQEIFIKIWVNRSKLSRVDLPNAYILTIAAHHTFDQFKKRLREQNWLHDLPLVFHTNEHNNIDEIVNFRESSSLIQEAVELLPPQQKKVFELSRDTGLNYEEISGLMNISKNTVRNHLVEALKSLRQNLNRHNIAGLAILHFILSSRW
jgi:RNA polymerase sigma-70 factor (family 1)